MSELVFIHGAGDSSAIWEHQVAYFAGPHNVLALDLPGHGGRLGEAAHDEHRENAKEALQEIQRHGLKAPVVVAHSMGGAVALTLAMEHGDALSALVLVATGARMRIHPDFMESARGRAEASPPGQVAGPAVPLDMAVSPAVSPETRRWLEEHAGRATAQAIYADFRANDRFDAMERLEGITQPTLVLGGLDDKLTPSKFQQYLAEHIAQARLELIPEAGHYLFVEQAARFNQLLASFLEGLEK